MLKAGFARLDITLPLGTNLAGYYEPRYATGVLDPLSLNAIAISDGTQTVLLITVDALGIRETFCKEILALITERTGVPADHIIINALHQHTSFVLRPKGDPCALQDTAYIDLLYRKFCDVSQMAIDDMEEAVLAVSIAPALEKLSFIRRYLIKDGRVLSNPFNDWQNIIAPVGNADNDVRLLKFMRSEKKDIALVNFCTHPDVVGQIKISADWPGFVRRFVEEDHKDTHCLLVNGFQGDSNHVNYQTAPENRGYGYRHSEKMGRVIADTVNTIWETGIVQDKTNIRAAQTVVYNKTRTDGIEDYEICKPIRDEFLKTFRIPEDAPIKDLAYLFRVSKLRTDPIWRSIPVSAISIGDVAFIGLGGEPFTHYAEAIREGVADKFVISVTCANGFEGYLPTEEAYAKGSYEVTASPFTPELESQCVNAAIELLKNI